MYKIWIGAAQGFIIKDEEGYKPSFFEGFGYAYYNCSRPEVVSPENLQIAHTICQALNEGVLTEEEAVKELEPTRSYKYIPNNTTTALSHVNTQHSYEMVD